jgi:hypothetical protein
MDSERNWGHDRCLPIAELVKQRLPLQRAAKTWSRWFESGIVVNGVLEQLPQIYIEGVRHSSVEAVVEFFNRVGRKAPPDAPQRKRRRKHG